MSPTTLYRGGGTAAVIGCILMVIGALGVTAVVDRHSMLLASSWFVWAIGAMLVLLGLPAIYAHGADKAGILGLVGFVAMSLYFFIHGIFLGLIHGLVLPVLATTAPDLTRPKAVGLTVFVGALLVLVGSISFGIATARGGVYPRTAGALVAAGGLIMFVGHPVLHGVEVAGFVLFMAGLGWLGLNLLSTMGRSTRVLGDASSAVR